MTLALHLLGLLQVTSSAAPDSGTFWGLKASEWIMILAIILGPIFAVVTQFAWQKNRQKREQKMWVFNTLMGLRAAMHSPEFVKALNFIDVVFHKNAVIRTKWKNLLNYFYSDAYKPQNYTALAHEKTKDLVAELLSEIGKELGYKFDYTHIKDSACYPTLFGMADEESMKLRQRLIAALEGSGTLSVKLVENANHSDQALLGRPSMSNVSAADVYLDGPP